MACGSQNIRTARLGVCLGKCGVGEGFYYPEPDTCCILSTNVCTTEVFIYLGYLFFGADPAYNCHLYFEWLTFLWVNPHPKHELVRIHLFPCIPWPMFIRGNFFLFDA